MSIVSQAGAAPASRSAPTAPPSPWRGEFGGDSPDQVRWIQSSLNSLLGLRLAVDGVVGPATRSAIRSFQNRMGLTPDGVVGPQTRAALAAASGAGGARPAAATPPATATVGADHACEVLDRFAFDDDKLLPEHVPQLESMARRIINNQASSARVIGHTDPEGDFHYNVQLGRRRAEQASAALRRTVERLQPGSGSQLALSIESGGEAHRVSSDPERNRRVEICLPPPTVRPWTPGDPNPRPIARRFCCLLAPQQVNSVTSNDNVADPANLGQHGGWSEVNGILYCGKAGFLDLAHIRDSCDTTKYIFDHLASGAAQAPIFVKYRRLITHPRPVGVAVVRRRPLRPIDVARAIAYDVGLGHEIATYYDMGMQGIDVGGHNSSFSPEDLCSNFLGTLLAERAIAAGGRFDDAVTAQLNALIRDLDGQSPSETLKAFNLINGRWVMYSRSRFYWSITRPDYLRRRNFTRTPWAAGHSSDKPPPSYVTAALPNPGPSAYTYTHMEEASTRRLSALFPTYVNQIMQDARQRYGPRFDQPK